MSFVEAKKEKAPPTEEEKARKLAGSKAYWLNLPAPKRPKKKER